MTSAGAALGVLLVLWFLFGRSGEEKDPYRTQAVDRGEILRAVSATGQLQPLVTVNVGSTVSGPVLSVDVDFNSTVKANQVLARIDPQSFQTRVDQLRAGVAQAQANYASAQAEYGRYKILAEQDFASDQLMIQQRTAVQVARAQVTTAASQLSSAQIDMSRTIIRSPVDGVVVSRQVDPGQSVAASFQAPVLFQIAQDLSKLEAAISVDEADIGDVAEGQKVTFTVDAFPGEDFDGKVVQVRKQGVATSGVVSYTVMVEAENARKRLLPGMTANAEIIIERKADVLRAPSAALRFKPTDEKLVAQADKLRGAARGNRNGGGSGGQNAGQGAQGRNGQMLARIADRLKLTDSQRQQAEKAFEDARANAGAAPGGDADQSARRAYQRKVRDAAMNAIAPILTPEQKTLLDAMRKERENNRVTQSVLWVLRDKKPTPVLVQLGAASDSYTEILGGDIKEGDLLITGGGPKPKTDTQQNNRGQGGPGGGGGVRIRGA
ncbi:MAG: efflux RND transporter periplasmic adaptor subunit [Caulobacterales bacterium]